MAAGRPCGHRFGAVREILANYRIGEGSSSTRTWNMLDCGLQVMRTGHAPDPRVRAPSPEHMLGRFPDGLFACEVHMVFWSAASLLMQGHDAIPNFESAFTRAAIRDCHLFSRRVHAGCLRSPLPTVQLRLAAGLPTTRSRKSGVFECRGSPAQLPGAEPFCGASAGKPHRREHVPRMAPVVTWRDMPDPMGRNRALEIRATAQRAGATALLGDMERPADWDRLKSHCSVPSAIPYILSDAVAARYAWSLLRAFFEETVYSTINLSTHDKAVTAWRGDVPLATWVPVRNDPQLELHDQAGWTVFLQELWGRPHWDGSRFYTRPTTAPAPQKSAANPPAMPEDSADTSPLPQLEIGGNLECEYCPRGTIVTFAGNPLGCLKPSHAACTPEDWIVEVNNWSAFELCRVAVRDLILGAPRDGRSLRERLRHRLAERRQSVGQAAESGAALLTDSTKMMFRQLVPPGDRWAILGRRCPLKIGLSSSRRSALPGAGMIPLVELARRRGEPHAAIGDGATRPQITVYAPEFVPATPLPSPRSSSRNAPTLSAKRTRDTAQRDALPILAYGRVGGAFPGQLESACVSPKPSNSSSVTCTSRARIR